MKIYDVSMLIHLDMPVYKEKADKRPAFETTSDFTNGSAHETRLHLDAHTGTHIDAPLHMIVGGATIESIDLHQLVRRCRVVDVTDVVDAIHAADVAKLNVQAGEFILFHTTNSKDDAWNGNFVFIAEDGAEALAAAGVAGVGVDGLGVERSQPTHATHKRLFAAGAVIIEGLRLDGVPAGEYQMVALPLRLTGIDAAPARVILLAD